MNKASTETTPVEQSSPWSADVLTASSPPDQGWANFESSPFLANFGYELSSTIATSASDDMDRVPFDLTPTEASSMPFPGDDSSSPPDEWPSETPADVNKNLTNDILFQAMETAHVTTSEHSAEIIAASDIVKSRPDASLSSCLPSSTAQPLMAAFTPETVIEQTDHFDNSALPLTNPSDDVTKQLSDLLAEVSVADGGDFLVNSSENRTLCDSKEDVTNGPDPKPADSTIEDTSPIYNST